MPFLCLIIGASADTVRRLQRELPACGVKPYSVDSCQGAMLMLQQWRFDAVVLDAVGFGEHTGAALQRLHRHVRTPIVLLDAASDVASQVEWLEGGASDVLAPPVSARLLAAKLRRLVEAQGAAEDAPGEVQVGPLVMDARSHVASVNGRRLDLTSHQFELLFMMASRLGQFVTREHIARALRSPDGGRSPDVHVYRIRKRLREVEATGLSLDTVHGRGYCLSLEAPATADDFASAGSLEDPSNASPA